MADPVHRRALLRAAALAGTGLAADALLPAWARSATGGPVAAIPTLEGPDIALTIGHAMIEIDGKMRHAVAVNGGVPGPLLRLKQGQNVRLSVTNALDEDTSIHWHGLLLPFQFDGVPGVSFPGIRPGETFVYRFPVVQAGTYWYHSHSGLQEQMGHYGPIVIDPADPDPVACDREHVVVLSDFSALHPHLLMRRLKQQPGVFNTRKQTLAGLLAGRDQPLKDRIAWGAMRMDPTDISDVTGSVYSFLINGRGPQDNWTALFRPGERVRLRFVNAAAMTIFNVRIPGLKLTVVQADGQNVRPVEVDEFQISVAETYDVVVQPMEDKAYALVAEAVDRSGMGLATLAPRAGPAAGHHEGHGHGHGRHAHARHGDVHARPPECAAGQARPGGPDDLADARRPHRRAGAGAGGRRPPGAGLSRPGRRRSQPGHPPAVPRARAAPDRQYGAVHVGLRRRGL
jgi:CopA family copper-resistance protein